MSTSNRRPVAKRHYSDPGARITKEIERSQKHDRLKPMRPAPRSSKPGEELQIKLVSSASRFANFYRPCTHACIYMHTFSGYGDQGRVCMARGPRISPISCVSRFAFLAFDRDVVTRSVTHSTRSPLTAKICRPIRWPSQAT